MKVFDSVPVKVPDKNVFNLSHDVKATYNFDKLYPFLVQPIYPGDTFNARAEVFLRAMPLLCPVMHNVDMHIHFFFVPNRLVFNQNRKADWKIYITGGEDGKQRPVLPYTNYSQLMSVNPKLLGHGSLLDHMGFPTIDDPDNATIRNGGSDFTTLPFRAYQLIYNEYYRNQNLQPEVEFSYDQGQESNVSLQELFKFRKKCWEKDYFTSALPFLQRGNAMLLPIEMKPDAPSVLAPVKVNTGNKVGSETEYGIVAKAASSGTPASATLAVQSPGLMANDAIELHGTATINAGTLTFTGLSIGTINDFRYCLRLQQWMENNARCGSRYIEQLFSHFGVRSSDARLQRPELLGGGKVPLIFTDVPQTSFGEGTDRNVVGDLAGKGTMYGKTSGFKKYFEEHGILFGILSIIPRTSYSQGIPRPWSVKLKEDWYFPEFSHLGEQAILNKEIYYNPTEIPELGKGPEDVFGYQGRFTELRYIPSTFHGEMRSSLNYWHFGNIFNSLPVLNSDFVTANSRVDSFALADVANGDEDPFVCQIHLDIKAVRPMPKYAVPTL